MAKQKAEIAEIEMAHWDQGNTPPESAAAIVGTASSMTMATHDKGRTEWRKCFKIRAAVLALCGFHPKR